MNLHHLTRTADEVAERIDRVRRRRPRLRDDHVTLAHGAGGKASAALVDAVFVEAFANDQVRALGDAAVLPVAGASVAFSTDSFVVHPLRFPGGSIGDLAVNGTVNDLAMAGARPRWLSAAFVLEEGFPVADLRRIAEDMADAAGAIGVAVVTGDTKVVPRGAADGLYVSTAGFGVIPTGRRLGPDRVRPGDRVLLSGPMGAHGVAVMLARDGLGITADVRSDTAPLPGLVEALLAAAPATRWLRDPTRGGVGTVVNELARAAGVGVVLEEGSLPVTPAVAGVCELLGIDPLHVANEGRLVAVVDADEAPAALAAMRAHPLGAGAVDIGGIVADPTDTVVMRTTFGGSRVVDMLVGDPLPRIC